MLPTTFYLKTFLKKKGLLQKLGICVLGEHHEMNSQDKAEKPLPLWCCPWSPGCAPSLSLLQSYLLFLAALFLPGFTIVPGSFFPARSSWEGARSSGSPSSWQWMPFSGCVVSGGTEANQQPTKHEGSGEKSEGFFVLNQQDFRAD